MSVHDRYSSEPVEIRCECGHGWDGTLVSDYGVSWLEPHEQCPVCGSEVLDVSALDALDIEERKLEARGENF